MNVSNKKKKIKRFKKLLWEKSQLIELLKIFRLFIQNLFTQKNHQIY